MLTYEDIPTAIHTTLAIKITAKLIMVVMPLNVVREERIMYQVIKVGFGMPERYHSLDIAIDVYNKI
jgi:hypothetical protein